jgi:hypothetical protein
MARNDKSLEDPYSDNFRPYLHLVAPSYLALYARS